MASTSDNTNTNIHFLKPSRVEDMRDAAYLGSAGDRDDAIVTTLYDTGLRRAELSQLNTDMIDLDEAALRIPPGIQKGYPNDRTPSPVSFRLDPSGGLRTIRSLRGYLTDRDDDSSALFSSRKHTRLTGKGINDVVKRLADRAEVRPYRQDGRGDPGDVTGYTLWHSVAWRMLRAEDGNEIYDVKNRLRHSTVATTERRYTHFQFV